MGPVSERGSFYCERRTVVSVFWQSECFVRIVRFRFGISLKRSESKMKYSVFLIEDLPVELPPYLRRRIFDQICFFDWSLIMGCNLCPIQAITDLVPASAICRLFLIFWRA
jgi:hypothetical protein